MVPVNSASRRRASLAFLAGITEKLASSQDLLYEFQKSRVIFNKKNGFASSPQRLSHQDLLRSPLFQYIT